MLNNTFITHLQVFGIGFSLGIVGPCLLTCTPVLVAYTAASKRGFGGVLADIIVFSSARLSAYVILGALAGLSGRLLNGFVSSGLALFFRPLAGLVSVMLGIFVLVGGRAFAPECESGRFKALGSGGLFVLGFTAGIAPCAPLSALLLEIALMSKGAIEGASYALSFGLGAFLSCLIVAGGLSGILKGLTAKLIKSKTANLVFRVICGLLLVLLGAGFIIRALS